MDEILYYLGIKKKPWGIRAIVYDKGVKILKERKYRNISKIGSGGYGDVVKLRAPGKKKIKIAAKIISSFARSPGESELWKNFDHPNVLPLLDVIQEPEVDIYFMPMLKKSLDKALLEDNFRLDEKAFEVTKIWMRDVSQGLQHLHDMNVAHLDLKIDNVLIDSNDRAVICDFSCTAVMDKKIESYGLTKYFRPPEVCSSLGKMIPVEGREFDAWSYGMLAHYTWTRVMSIDGNEITEYWKKVAYPAIFDSLTVSNFRSSLQEQFPKSVISDQDLIHSLNLLKGVLRYDASSRPLIFEIIRHPLIKASQYGASLLEVDDIWTWKMDLTGENVINKSDIEIIANEITEKGDIPDTTDVVSREEMMSTTTFGKITNEESKQISVKTVVVVNQEYLDNVNTDINENLKEYVSPNDDDKELLNADCEEVVKNFLQPHSSLKAEKNKSFPDLAVEEKVTLQATEDNKVVQPSSTTEEDTPAAGDVTTDSETLADDHLTSLSEEVFQGTREKTEKVGIFSRLIKKFRFFRKA